MTSDTKLEVITEEYPYTIRITIGEPPIEDIFEFVCEKDKENNIEFWELDFYDENGENEMAPKSRGVAIKLFAALPEAFKMFIRDKRPKDFRFTSKTDESSRVRLYDRLSKMVKRFKVERYREDDGEYVTWRFTK